MLDFFSDAGKIDRAKDSAVFSKEHKYVIGNMDVSMLVSCWIRDLTAFRIVEGPDISDTRRLISLVNVSN
jgi:hypothetical protein